MALPASLLHAVETHVCFSGCYGTSSDVLTCTSATQPPQCILHVSCEDCLGFHVGVLTGLLPSQMTGNLLARELSAHVRKLRGYSWSIGGYHYSSRLWLSAAYYPCGLFMLDGSHNDGRSNDLDVLIAAFRSGLLKPQDPRMLDPALYVTQQVYIDMSVPIFPVHSMQDILMSPQCSTSFQGHGQGRRVTLAEFQPIAAQAGQARSSAAPASTPSGQAAPAAGAHSDMAADTAPIQRRPMRPGERCPVCGAVVKERPSLTDTFVGCLC